MKEYINIDELSEYLGIKKPTLYAKTASGQIPHYKIGRLVRFKKAEIGQWVEGLKQKTMDTDKKPREILKRLDGKKTSNVDIDNIVKKTIASVKVKGYNSANGKPGHSLGEEV